MEFYVPLISAAIAGLVAITVTNRQGHTARDNWVLDKRYTAYSGVLDSAFDVAASDFKDRAKLLTLAGSLVDLDLVSPTSIREYSDHVTERIMAVYRGEAGAEELRTQLDALIKMLHEDLVPKRLR